MHLSDLRSHRAAILQLAAQYKAEDVRIFGSVARGEAHPRDIDFLVHFKSGASLLDEAGLDIALTNLLGQKVDIIGDDVVRAEFKPFIDAEAVPL